MNDIALAFDPTGFLSGIKAVENQLVSLNSNFQKAGDTGNKKNQQVQLSAKNLMAVFAKLGAVVGTFKMVLSGIPEIGRTFKIAGDIFQRNLLWPLRKELIPILQSVLDWARDNRAMFVRWGTVIANTFRAVFNIIKQIVKMGRDLFNQLIKGLEQIFGKTVNSVTEMANIILFKVAAVVMFIMMTLEPVFKWIVDKFLELVKNIKLFVEGFMEGFGSIMPVIEEFKNQWDRIVKLFDKLIPKQSSVNSLFSKLGSILGTTVLAAVMGLVQGIDFLVHSLSKAVNGYQKLKAAVKGNWAEVERLDIQAKQEEKDFQQRSNVRSKMIEDSIKRTWKFVTSSPKGEVTTNNNQNGNTTIQNDNKVVNINVNESKTPKETADSIDEKLREARFRAGGR